ncbi:Di-sulfide bridge nucleocytoplasmic transport domain-containing protein [Infundibulicybe gibba]|nr:Di-sulfide bridge nucleocytoplasmic transport domain-containing protein [Infundibulicybe gibba]
MMSSRLKAERSTEAPMDFQFTNRPSSNVKPVWASDDPETPRKRPHDDTNITATLSTPYTPSFGSNQNIPFIFQSANTPQTPHKHPWAPPPNFSPAKAFPQPIPQVEINDVDMFELSPPKPDESKEGDRPVAFGAMRRVFKSRQKSRDMRIAVSRNKHTTEDQDGHESFDDDDDELAAALTQNTSNHYTLNIPAPPAPQSDIPYILLGYLQFFFNLSLILLFLYLVLQFVLTVQRDVEQRISEYSMDIVQEIAICALQFKNNLCASNPIPAMAQQCGSWQTCMNRDPTVVGRAKVGAELIAEVVNGFVEPISWKTLAFTLTSLSFLTVFINALLSLYRSRHHPITAPPPLHPQHFPIAPTAPYPGNQFGGFLSPAPTPSWGRTRYGPVDEDLQSPTRRRRIEGGGAIKIK